MIKRWLKGFIAVGLLSLLFATIAPAPQRRRAQIGACSD